VRQQEYSVDDRTARKVEQLNCPELANDGRDPGFKHLRYRHLVCDGEHEVEIRPPVSFIVCKRANHSSGYDPRVRRGDVQYQVPHAVAVANVEHDGILNPEGLPFTPAAWRSPREPNQHRGDYGGFAVTLRTRFQRSNPPVRD
jgi:hypothetical protein